MVVVDEGKKEKEGERRSFIGCVGTESTSLPALQRQMIGKRRSDRGLTIVKA
jgi:hypothetical protein